MMLYLLYILIGILTLGLYLVFKPRKKLGKLLPGPKGWPLLGNWLDAPSALLHKKLYQYARQYGEIFAINIFGTKLVVLNSPALVIKASNEDPYRRHMSDRSPTFYGEKILYGNQDIIFAEHAYGSLHEDLRKEFTRAMHFYGEGRDELEEKVQTELEKVSNQIKSYNGEEFDFTDIIKRSLTHIIASVLGGHDMNIEEEDILAFWEFDDAANFIVNHKVNILLRAFPFVRFIPSIYRQRYQEIVHAKTCISKKFFYDLKKTHVPGTVKGFVDFLIEEQLKSQNKGDNVLLTDERIICMILDTISAGVLTTFSTICSLFLCLINHPEYQTKIQDEIDAVIGRDRRPTFADRHNCPINEAVTLELMRYVPVLPIAANKCNADINFEGYEVEEKSLIVINAWFINHDERIWGDPWTFRPERFLDNNGQLLPKDHLYRKSLLPFGTGRRQCLGESFARSRVFLFISTLLQQWSFTMDEDKMVPCDPDQGAYVFDTACLPPRYKCRVVQRK